MLRIFITVLVFGMGQAFARTPSKALHFKSETHRTSTSRRATLKLPGYGFGPQFGAFHIDAKSCEDSWNLFMGLLWKLLPEGDGYDAYMMRWADEDCTVVREGLVYDRVEFSIWAEEDAGVPLVEAYRKLVHGTKFGVGGREEIDLSPIRAIAYPGSLGAGWRSDENRSYRPISTTKSWRVLKSFNEEQAELQKLSRLLGGKSRSAAIAYVLANYGDEDARAFENALLSANSVRYWFFPYLLLESGYTINRTTYGYTESFRCAEAGKCFE